MQGSLPDMTATTALYLDLQRIYREQADRDIAAVTKHVQNVLSSISRDPGSISASEIRMFCKHVRCLRYAIGLVHVLLQCSGAYAQVAKDKTVRVLSVCNEYVKYASI